MESDNHFETAHSHDKMTTRQASRVATYDDEWNCPEETTKNFPVHVIKRRNVGVPKFLRFLFQILEMENPAIITWSHEGTAFQIIQPEELACQILPKYFKHNKVSSFQRQLNYFGFKKWTKTQTNVCTFSHPFFVRADKDRMKLIKRKERANATVLSAAMAATITSNSIEIMNHLHAPEKARASSELHCEAQDLAGQLSTQQALKRQKSNILSGTTVTFLNSAAAGRRHSTGMLPGSEAFGLAAAAAAAAAAASADSFEPGRKRAGTPAEQEFELEMEARVSSAANSASMHQPFTHMRKIAETKESSEGYSYPPAHGKRQSLPHVLPPGFGDAFGTSMNVNATGGVGNGGYRSLGANILGRRKSDQLLNGNSNIGGSSDNKGVSISQIEEFMASSSTSASQQPLFASNIKNDASVVLPVSANSANDAYELQQQRQLRQQVNRQQQFGSGGYGYGVKPQSSNGWPTSIKSESSSGWQTSVNANSSSAGNTSYQLQPQNHSMMMPLKFGGSNAPHSTNPSFQDNIIGSMGFSHTASGGDRKLQQRPLTSYPQQYQSHEGQVASYQQQQQNGQQERDNQQPRDYIDVLLESAGVDDNLPPQSSTMLSSESWNGHPENDPSSESTGSFTFMQTQQQLQLSSMRGMRHNPVQRF
ncbi:hypothetical protein KXD40_008070 [Peronospora effusa]|uniref:HSF-type DNA-binding domain-containing protein n=1 Tax=Peronospora effusa TaxID=542832 RepID=A0A3M6VG72_9STRA|nr:hypothetical protein DD238_005085 [Peronospora effusa]RQM10409.1 hypothetical protein DD237_005442 [Peronospora effusa]UIZ24238.1 hypothetical protein KXD40_008070 [Peronospora effusa]